MDDIKQTSKGVTLRSISLAKAPVEEIKPYTFDVKPPQLAPGVAPQGVTPPVMAMDYSPYSFASQTYSGGGFPGFVYLAQLATRSEFRSMASAYSTELTREWIKLTSKQDDGSSGSSKIKLIDAELTRLGVRDVFQKGAEHDCLFGRAQFYIGIKGADPSKPLILDPRTVKKGSLDSIIPIESIWTTPADYDANDPTAPSFYRPSRWYMLGKTVHATRLMTVVTRPLPDLLKPAYNFAGISLSQLAEPYVDNWLRTRQSVSDLINNFSITVLATSMDQVLQGNDDGASVIKRAELFTAMRSNRGLMLLDKEREEIQQVNTPLSGLHELQAQSQEQMCAVSRTPAIILTGISPSGLNASSEGEIKVYYDWIAAQQNAFWRAPLETIIKVIQLSLFGEIDPDIGFDFVPLYQMTPEEIAAIRKSNMETDSGYINAGVLDPSEARERLARDADSGYMGLDLSAEIVPPNEPDPFADPTPPAQDADFKEGDHPRAANGKFGSGSGNAKTKKQNYKTLEMSNRSTLPKIPVQNVFKNGLGEINSQNRESIDKIIELQKVNDLPILQIDIEKIVPTQKNVNIENIKKVDGIESDDDPILAIEQNGKYYLIDGHHRVSSAILNGETSVNMRVLKTPPAQDADFKESDHPRAANGQFGSGGGGGASASADKPKANKSYKNGGKDERGYERGPGLPKAEREVEQHFIDAIHEHKDHLINAYHAVNGNVIDPDLVKGLSPHFANNPDLARAVHEPSSFLAKEIYSQALERKAAAGDKSPTLFSAGGGGSGKSATRPVAEAAFGADPNGIFYDSTLSGFGSATKRIDEALAKTEGDVGIVYTNTPISTALEFNAGRTRTVSIDTLLHAHVGASDTIRKLAEHYADNPRVQIAIINNKRGETPQVGDVADVPKYNAFEIRQQLVDQATDLLESGKIDQTKYKLLIK